MNGPCMCGDAYCKACGGSSGELEAAEEWLIEQLAKANLTAEEHLILFQVGLLAVRWARQAKKSAVERLRADMAFADAVKEQGSDD